MQPRSKVGGRYEILTILRPGGIGVVYKAHDAVTRRDVALKTLRDSVDPALLELFAREWSVLANICHPNIVDVLDQGEMEDEDGLKRPYFIMPLLPGKGLDQILTDERHKLTVHRVVDMMAQTCRGLQAAHDRGIVHRDLKPSNLFILGDDTVKIIDFGMAYLVGSHSMTGLKGTLQYMPPEQVAMKQVSAFSDIYSLGVVCYEALSGRKPFHRRTDAETAEAIRHYFPPSIAELNSEVPATLGRVIHKAMAKHPRHRFSNAREFGESLQKALLGQPIDALGSVKLQPRIDSARNAFEQAEFQFATDILDELQGEGHVDAQITLLRSQLELAIREKTIRQLLETARARMQAGELGQASQKVEQALELDPQNPAAKALRSEIKKVQSAQQVQSWYPIVEQHLEQHAFSQARKAIDNILSIDAADVRARQLLLKVNEREQEFERLSTEKEQLYNSALIARESGDISTALSRMVRLLDLNRRAPDLVVAERDNVYLALYNDLCSRRDEQENAYTQGERQIAEGDFAGAIAICESMLRRYPDSALFQSLKIEAEDRKSQARSAYIAEFRRRFEAERDLNARLSIVSDAIARYPDESEFQQAQRLTEQRRDLVNSIVTRARDYEDRAQYNEALAHWETLRTIYSHYPGLDVEIQRIRQSRDEQLRQQEKAACIEQVERLMQAGDFARAHARAVAAVQEFPGDTELAAVEEQARLGLEHASEAMRLFEDGLRESDAGRPDRACELFRNALELDPANRNVRTALVQTLVEQARLLLDQDWRAAEAVIHQALEHAPGDTQACSLQVLISDRRRAEFIGEAVIRIRALQQERDYSAALLETERALREYPDERRLIEWRQNLQGLIEERRREQQRLSHRDALQSLLTRLSTADREDERTSLYEQSLAISRLYPGDGEIQNLAERAERAASPREPARTEVEIRVAEPAFSELTLYERTLLDRTLVNMPAVPDNDRELVEPGSGGTGVVRVREQEQAPVPSPQPTRISPALNLKTRTREQAREAALRTRRVWAECVVWLRNLQIAPRAAAALEASRRFVVRVPWYWRAVGVAIPSILVAALIWSAARRPPEEQSVTRSRPANVMIAIYTNPEGAYITIDGKARQERRFELPAGSYDVEVSKEGYKSVRQTLEVISAGTREFSFQLTPEPVQLQISTDLRAGRVALDGADVGQLESGSLRLPELPPAGAHKLTLSEGRREVFTLQFEAQPAAAPRITAVPAAGNVPVLVASAFGQRAVLYSRFPGMKATPRNGSAMPVTAEGAELPLSAEPVEVVIDDGTRPFSITLQPVSAPSLGVWVGAVPIAALIVHSNVADAEVVLDGRPAGSLRNSEWRRTLEPGKHTVRLQREGFEPGETIVELKRAESRTTRIDLPAIVVNATLVIEGGTPEAEVLVDDTRVGQIDRNGLFTANIAPGDHRVEVRKDRFEPARQTLKFGPGQKVSVNSKLVPFAEITFYITPAEATIRVVSPDGRDLSPAPRNRTTMFVRQGMYRVLASAPGYVPYEDGRLFRPDEKRTIDFQLVRQERNVPAPAKPVTLADVYQTSLSWEDVGDGFYTKRTDAATFLKPRAVYTFDVRLPSRRWGKQVKFYVDYRNDRNHVECKLDSSVLLCVEKVDGNKKSPQQRSHGGAGAVLPLSVSSAGNKISLRSGNAELTFDRPTGSGEIGFFDDGYAVRLR